MSVSTRTIVESKPSADRPPEHVYVPLANGCHCRYTVTLLIFTSVTVEASHRARLATAHPTLSAQIAPAAICAASVVLLGLVSARKGAL